jgi:2-oxoglutarate dehydrogenase E1 component
MMQEYRANSHLYGGNAPYVEEMYEAYLDNPGSVPENWRSYFDALQHLPAVDGSNERDMAHAPVVESLWSMPSTRTRQRSIDITTSSRCPVTGID